MKLSLNSQQKSDLIILDTLCFRLEETLKQWQQSKTMSSRKAAMKALKTGCTWLLKGLKLILADLDEGDIQALNRRKVADERIINWETLKPRKSELQKYKEAYEDDPLFKIKPLPLGKTNSSQIHDVLPDSMTARKVTFPRSDL